jgi:hypothetical protein
MMRVVPGAFPGVTVCDDVEAADWLGTSLRSWNPRSPKLVATLVPDAYPAHGRILHRTFHVGLGPVRWSEIAAMAGRPLTAATEYTDLVGWHWTPDQSRPPEPWGEPEQGSLPSAECAAVAEVLSGFTTTPDDCWFCVWAGYGMPELERSRARSGAPLVGLKDRDCILFHGPVSAATAFRSESRWPQSPTLWWPNDRAWCVASELDIYSTYVAAAPDALRALVDHPALEVLECSAEQHIDRGP